MAQPTPLQKRTAAARAEFVEDRGWLVPAHYGDPVAEYRLTRQQASLFDLSHHGKVDLLGPDAVAFFHNLSSNDIRALKPGEGCEAFLATAKAKLVAHLLVYRSSSPDGVPSLWLDCAPGKNEKVIKHLDHFLISEQVELLDRTRDFAQLLLAGPAAIGVLNQAAGEQFPTLREHQHRDQTLAGAMACQIRQHDPLGVPGFDVVCPGAAAEKLWDLLRTAGARPAGKEAYDCLRIEAGTPEDGIDFDENNLVMELGRTERAISFTKGCFPGQEPIVRSRDIGHVNWSLKGLRLSVATPVPAGTKIFRDGNEVGRITSSAFSPRFGKAIALAFIRRGSDPAGTAVEVAVGDERWPAEVSSLPFSA